MKWRILLSSLNLVWQTVVWPSARYKKKTSLNLFLFTNRPRFTKILRSIDCMQIVWRRTKIIVQWRGLFWVDSKVINNGWDYFILVFDLAQVGLIWKPHLILIKWTIFLNFFDMFRHFIHSFWWWHMKCRNMSVKFKDVVLFIKIVLKLCYFELLVK